MFQGLGESDIQKYPEGPFNNTTRILLVDSILRNLSFLSEKQRLKFKIENSLNYIISKNLNHQDEDQIRINGIVKVFDNLNSHKG